MTSGRTKEELQGVGLLGHKTNYPTDYAPEVLESFINKHPGNDYFVKFNCPEFTSLCPMTGQPDFATIYISYVPDMKLVESKSLKLYLFSFRNHGDFHEDCVNIIMMGQIYPARRPFYRPIRKLRQTRHRMGRSCQKAHALPRYESGDCKLQKIKYIVFS